ncbi:XkdF-like putative serine protease domain-containing protein [Rufibacter quisquiliarum]|uniref:Phage-like element PBSX protein XkdF domain-containing protein n=1 Tax=Rufibacter quisquiliarum TaxID=1549639 RepID=A0A839G9B5_9BACT|nr:XkdF-like putative serine protease domain-containing protein [Rufibacter quisquiliarum]MBA9076074.1 hypothetical protein [Rufibacter quisquiliarum]
MKRKEKAPVYAISIDDTEKTGVNLISFVSRPAIEADFVALSKPAPLLLAKDAHKQILTGPVLVPDKKIFRLSEDEEPFYITFSAETIEGIRNKFFKQGHTQATNHEHELPLDGNYVVESWIITDAEKDKAFALGLSGLPVGTWMVSYHVPDADYWRDKVMTGEVKGFSLEGFFNNEEVKEQLSKTDMPNPKGWHAKMSGLKLSTIELEDGSTIVHDPISNKLYSSDNDILPSGIYKTKQGVSFKVETSTNVYQWWYEQTEQKLSTDMSKNTKPASLFARMMKTFNSDKAAYNKLLMAAKTLEGGDQIEIDDDTKEVFKLDAEGNRGEALPDGTYTLEDGTTIEVVEGKLKEAEETPSAEEELSTAKAMIADLTKQLQEANAAKLAAETALAAEKENSTKLAADKVALQAQVDKKPAAAPVKLGGDQGPSGDEKLSVGAQHLAEARKRAGRN